MIEPREMQLQQEAIISLGHILGIMTDQMSMSEKSVWNVEHLYDLDARLAEHVEGEPITLGIDDVALLLEGMA